MHSFWGKDYTLNANHYLGFTIMEGLSFSTSYISVLFELFIKRRPEKLNV